MRTHCATYLDESLLLCFDAILGSPPSAELLLPPCPPSLDPHQRLHALLSCCAPLPLIELAVTAAGLEPDVAAATTSHHAHTLEQLAEQGASLHGAVLGGGSGGNDGGAAIASPPRPRLLPSAPEFVPRTAQPQLPSDGTSTPSQPQPGATVDAAVEVSLSGRKMKRAFVDTVKTQLRQHGTVKIVLPRAGAFPRYGLVHMRFVHTCVWCTRVWYTRCAPWVG